MLERQLLMFINLFRTTVWDHLYSVFTWVLPFSSFLFFCWLFSVCHFVRSTRRHHLAKLFIYQIGVYLGWHRTYVLQGHSQTQILTEAIYKKKRFLYIIFYWLIYLHFMHSLSYRNLKWINLLEHFSASVHLALATNSTEHRHWPRLVLDVSMHVAEGKESVYWDTFQIIDWLISIKHLLLVTKGPNPDLHKICRKSTRRENFIPLIWKLVLLPQKD